MQRRPALLTRIPLTVVVAISVSFALWCATSRPAPAQGVDDLLKDEKPAGK